MTCEVNDSFGCAHEHRIHLVRCASDIGLTCIRYWLGLGLGFGLGCEISDSSPVVNYFAVVIISLGTGKELSLVFTSDISITRCASAGSTSPSTKLFVLHQHKEINQPCSTHCAWVCRYAYVARENQA